MGSGSSIEYLQYMDSQAAMSDDGNGNGLVNNNSGGEHKIGDYNNASSRHSSFNASSSNNPGDGAGSAASMLRNHLLNTGNLLWKSAPAILQRMEALEIKNRQLALKVTELRGLLAKGDLFESLEQARRENEILKERITQLQSGTMNMNNNSNNRFMQSSSPFSPQVRRSASPMSPSRQTFIQKPLLDANTPINNKNRHSHGEGGQDSPFSSSLPNMNMHQQQEESSSAPISTSPLVNTFTMGQKVEVDFHGRGRFYSGKVNLVHKDGTVDIIYDDGDTENNVPAGRIRVLVVNETTPRAAGEKTQAAPSPAPRTNNNNGYGANVTKKAVALLKVGSQVEVNYHDSGNFFPGKINAVREMSPGAFLYDITYDDGDSEDMVPQERIKLLASFGAEPNHAKSNTLNAAAPQPKFQVGEEIECNFQNKGKFYVGKVQEMHADGTLNIQYDDGESEQHVEQSRLRKIDMSPLDIGKPVEANYRGSSNYFPGKVSGINSDGTYNIAYDDGDAEDNIKRSYIRTTEAAKATEANSNNANTSGTIGTGLLEVQKDQLLQIFRWSDHDRNGYLNNEEFQLWCNKVRMGDLYDQFEKLCDMLHCDPSVGIPAAALMELYEQEFKDEIESHHTMVLRDINLSGQFRIADKDGDGRLNVTEAQTLSDLKGIPFLGEENYHLLCQQMGCPGGLTEAQFKSLIDNFQNLEGKAADDGDMLANADIVRSVINNHPT